MVTSIARQSLVANGNTVYGQIVEVHKNEYTRPIAGLGDTSYSVSVSGRPGDPARTIGFASLADVKRFLHSAKDEEFDGYDTNGDKIKETRRGLGIPTGMMSQFSADEPKKG